MLAHLSYADPTGADVSFVSSDSGPNVTPESRTDIGGTITTITLDTTQQNSKWKAYVGNITGLLVLRNSDSWSIYEWTMNSSSFTGNVFVSRNDSVDWDNIKCANSTIINSEQTFLGMTSSDGDNINNTFNYTDHKAMPISGSPPDIAADSCPNTATYVNGSAQTVNENATFQELLLYDNVNLVYATFIDQDSWAYENNESVNGTNVTYDFQLIIAENESSPTGSVYYFYADISS